MGELTCRCCGNSMFGREVLCGACWAALSKVTRTAIQAAQRDLGRRYSKANVANLENAISTAVRSLQ